MYIQLFLKNYSIEIQNATQLNGITHYSDCEDIEITPLELNNLNPLNTNYEIIEFYTSEQKFYRIKTSEIIGFKK